MSGDKDCLKDIYDSIRENIMDNREFHEREYKGIKEAVGESSAYYHGEPVSFFYQPLFFSGKQVALFQDKCAVLNNILRKVTDRYLEDEEFRAYFDYPDLMKELILVDPGYGMEYPVARFDFFYDYNNRLKFCELNTDGSSGMNEARVLQREFKNSVLMEQLPAGCRVEDYELFYSLIEALFVNYREYCVTRGKTAKEAPNIGIMDFTEDATIREFEEFRMRFNELGCRAVICDPRELRYDGEKLFAGDLPLDLIYRRATTARLVENAADIGDFLQAYREGMVCTVGSFRSQIPHNKIIFAILHDREKVDFLTEEEHNFIARHIPGTVCFDPGNEELMQKLRRNKDEYILKPCDYFAGQGVYAGRDFTGGEWADIITNIGEEDYLVQEFVELPQMKMGVYEKGELQLEYANYILGVYLYNRQLSGLYARAGRENIIAAAGESRTLPVFVIRDTG